MSPVGEEVYSGGLVKAGVLANDTKAHVAGWEDGFVYGNSAGVSD